MPKSAGSIARLRESTLGIVAGNVAHRVTGGVASNVSNTRVYRELARRAGHAVLGITMLPERAPGMNDVLQWPSEDLIALPPMASTIAAQPHTFAAYRKVREVAARSDVLFVRMPFQIPWVLFGIDKPMVLHFGSDVYECVKASTDYHGPVRAAALTYARLGEACFRRQVRTPLTRVVTNGRALLEKYGATDHGVPVISSCLSASEMDSVHVRAPHSPPRLLFVGYLRPEKGVEVLLSAFHRLRQQRPISLTLAGGTDRATSAGQRIMSAIEASPYASDIDAVGHVEYGEALFDLYRSHDVFVLPSLSEGTPRALIEARAFNCPVVSTRVGGITHSVRDGYDGLLVDSEDPAALAREIARVLDDEALRTRLVENGAETARKHSLEAFCDRLSGQLDLALEAGALARI